MHLTVSPSVMCSYSPRITEPTESRSRFSARPNVLFGNSSISPCIASDRPWMRQMPSVTDTTVPCVRDLRARVQVLDLGLDQFADFGRVQLHGVSQPLADEGRPSSEHAVAFVHRGELALHRAVDHGVADRDARAADQIARSTITVASTLLPNRRSSAAVSSASSAVGQLGSALSIVALATPSASSLQRLEQRRRSRGISADAVGLDQHAHEVAAVRVEPVAGDRQQQRLLRRRRRASGCRAPSAHARVRRPTLRASPSISRPHGQRVLLARELERGFGVRAGDRGQFGHGGRLQLLLDLAQQLGVRLARRLRASGSSTRRRPRARRPSCAAAPWRARLPARSRPSPRRRCGRLRPSRRPSPAPSSRPELLADGDDLGGPPLASREHVGDRASRCSRGSAPALLAGGQAVGDLLLARLDRTISGGHTNLRA